MNAHPFPSTAAPVEHARRSYRAGDVLWIVALALGLRLLTYNGIFGSDDGTYFDRALDVASGTFSSANYNGALRYGFNLPAGLMVWAFGPTPFVANLWPLFCSLFEIALVYVMAAHAGGRSAGVFAALLLAMTPLHVAVATRIHADPVVSASVTLSYVLLCFGWERRDRRLLFCCGLALGAIFWSKELVAVVWLTFLPLLYLFRGRWSDAGVVVAGLALSLAADGVLMMSIAGDPLHQVHTVLGQVGRSFISEGAGEDAPGYYLRFLSFDVRHVGLLVLAPVVGLVWARHARSAIAPRPRLIFVCVWFVGLLAVLSILPVSLSPVRFVMKQSNYITLFLAPIAILGGLALAAIPARKAVAMVTLTGLAGVAIALLQQADYRAFSANSKALGQWALLHPDAVVVGSPHNAALAPFWARSIAGQSPVARVLSTRDTMSPDGERSGQAAAGVEIWALIDPQTLDWQSKGTAVGKALPCWRESGSLLPTDLAAGNRFAGLLARTADSLAPAGRLASALHRLAQPVPATLYRVGSTNPSCAA